MIVVFTGGTGGAKLIEGLAAEITPAELTIICNTGDDAVFHGLYVSPDIDTIIYTLAGMIDTDKGWGIKHDTFEALKQLDRFGAESTWFTLGDRDLATHIMRTKFIGQGLKLSEITDRFRRTLGVQPRVLPMTDERVESRLETPEGEISFQEFFVRDHWAPDVTRVRFAGAEQSSPAPGVTEAIRRADAIIIAPSNPITSIGPILAVPGIRAALLARNAPVVGVSPLIAATAISGPAHKLMVSCGLTPSALGVAQYYAGLMDKFFIGREDQGLASDISARNINPLCTDIRMPTAASKRHLAREVLASIGK
jgi:LPPG:FO 2-phospho-L-lactate transferase